MVAAGDAAATPGGEHPEPAVQPGTPDHPRTPDEIPDDRLLDEAYALQGYIRELREELREAEELHKALLERAHGLGIRENEAYAVRQRSADGAISSRNGSTSATRRSS